jgi:hypothetical protein
LLSISALVVWSPFLFTIFGKIAVGVLGGILLLIAFFAVVASIVEAIKNIKSQDGTVIKYSKEWAYNLSVEDGDLLFSVLEELSKKMRGDWKSSSFRHANYRVSSQELFADVFSSYILQPRATKRMAKPLFKEMDL